MRSHPSNRPCARLIQLAQATLAGAAILASGALLAGEGQAATRSSGCNFGGGTTRSSRCGSAPISLGDTLLTILNADTLNAPGYLDFTWFDPDGSGTSYANDSWGTNIIFDLPVTDANGYLEYTLQVVGPGLAAGWQFNSADLDSNHAGRGAVVSETISEIQANTHYLSSINGMPSSTATLSSILIGVRDDISAANTAQLISFSNNFSLSQRQSQSQNQSQSQYQTPNQYQNRSQTEVPGPLPLVGAGAAFGFSRRIRSRLKSTRLS